MANLLNERITRRLQEAGDQDFISRLLAVYLQQTEEYLDELDEALASQDEGAARRIMHKMTGACSVVGAEAMVERIGRMREAVKSKGDWSQAVELLPELKTINVSTIEALRKLLADQG